MLQLLRPWSYIGRALDWALARVGSSVCLLDIEGNGANEEAVCLQDEFGIPTSAFCVDLTDEKAVEAAAEHVRQHHGRLDVLVNNAAYPVLTSHQDGKAIEQQTSEQRQPNVDVNLRGTFLATRAFVPQLRPSKHGVIISIASIYGVVGPDMRLYEGADMGNSAWYAAAKGGIV